MTKDQQGCFLVLAICFTAIAMCGLVTWAWVATH